MYAPRRLSAAVCALVLVLAAGFAALLLAPPAMAAENRVVTVNAAGVTPAALQIEPKDTVTFVVANRVLGGYRLASTGGQWTFSGRVGDLLGSDRFTVPQELGTPGTYTYTATGGGKTFQGSVVIPAPADAPAAPPPSGAPAPAVPKPGSPAPAPPPTGGSGSAALPPLAGGFGSVQQPGPLPGSGLAQAPALAAPLLSPDIGGPLLAPPLTASTTLTPIAVAGVLPGQPTMRPYGLPAAIAAVLAGGVLSLLVRVRSADSGGRSGGSSRRADPAAATA